MINTVVFDIGNVLIDFRWQGLFEDLGFCGEKFERIADATVRSQWWNEFDRGIMKRKFEAFLTIWIISCVVVLMPMTGFAN